MNTPQDVGQYIPIYSQAFNQGSYVVNYRNEPMPFRVNYWVPPFPVPQNPQDDPRFSLANAYSSITRFDPQLNIQPPQGSKIAPVNDFKYPAPFTGAGPLDPYTPLLRAYQGDNVQVRTLVGSQIAPHSFNINGLPWLYEPGYAESGYINAQTMGISEHFEMLFQLPFLGGRTADYLYRPSSGIDGFQRGSWGLLRSYPPDGDAPSLPPLQPAKGPALAIDGEPAKTFKVYVLVVPAPGPSFGIPSPGDMVAYVNEEDLIVTFGPTPDVITSIALKNPNLPIEPLILRCNAGEIVKVKLINYLIKPLSPIEWQISNPVFLKPNSVNLVTQPLFTTSVGLDVQMLAHDPVSGPGLNVGANNVTNGVVKPDHLVPPPIPAPGVPNGYKVSSRDYTWYAGTIDPKTGARTPVEFGAVNLLPADSYVQQCMGLIGALIVEPAGSTFLPDYQPKVPQPDANDPRKGAAFLTRASGTVMGADSQPLFREFVAVFDDANSIVTGTSINYWTAPLAARGNPTQATMAKVVSDYQLDIPRDPPTPVFPAAKGSPVRLRMLHPGGSGNDMTIALHGHVWQEEPWQMVANTGAMILGDNPKSNWQGSHDRFGPNTAFNLLLGPGKATGGAGGVNQVNGDYLLRNMLTGSYENGAWGLVRVGDPGKDVVSIINYPGAPGSTTGVVVQPNVEFVISGRNTVNLASGRLANQVTAAFPGGQFAQNKVGPFAPGQLQLPVDTDGTWSVWIKVPALPATITVNSPEGGSGSIVIPSARGSAHRPAHRDLAG